MYGLVNKSIEELVTQQFGEQKWEEIKLRSGVDVDFFLSNEPYDDEITFKLATTAAQELNVTVDDVLTLFGEFWVLDTAKKKYGDLMAAGGDNLKDFLIHLPNFHDRIILLFPKVMPPEFSVSNITDNSLYLHYKSKREGLQAFVLGLLQGLGKMYQVSVTIENIQKKADGHSHEIFKISW
ncbi:MAG: heme NO-binding domain-containing protein [Chitinophagaceae bacterium]